MTSFGSPRQKNLVKSANPPDILPLSSREIVTLPPADPKIMASLPKSTIRLRSSFGLPTFLT